MGGIGNTLNNKQYGGHSDVQSPQFQNTNGLLFGGGRGGRFNHDYAYGSGHVGSGNINGGFLAGGGAGAVSTAERAVIGGDGGIGGGGGTANTTQNTSEGYLASGEGGNGLIIVMYTALT